MELRHLRYFAAVAESGQFTRAAEQLGIQQPPLSQQIKQLEDELGLPLLRRHPKGVALTDAGRVFLAEAQRLLADVDRLRARMARLAGGHEGEVAVGFTSSAAAHAFTPRALRECRRRLPGLALQLSEDPAATLTEALADGRVHCGLLRVPVARPEGLRFVTLLREPVLLAVPADHRLAAGGSGHGLAAGGSDHRLAAGASDPQLTAGASDHRLTANEADAPVPLAALAGEPLILVRRPGAPGLYAELLALCRAEGVEVRIAAEVDRMMSNLNLVAAGMGLSVVPASMRGAHPGAVVYRPLADGGRLDAPLTLAYRDGEDSPAVLSFIALVTALAADEPGAAPPG